MNDTTPLLRNHAKEKLARGETVYSMTVRLEVPASCTAVSQLTTVVESSGGSVTGLDVTASGHEKLRIDVAAFGRPDGEDLEPSVVEQRRLAHEAIARTAGVLEFIGSRDEPAARELQRLYDAVAPLLTSGATSE